MKRIVLGILLGCSAMSHGQEELHGVFSNEAEGFKIVTLMVHDSGYAYFHAAVAGVIGEWSYDKAASTVTFEYFDPGPNKDATIKFLFDPKRRAYTFVDGTLERADSSKILHFITNTIPEQLIQAFRTYPEELENHRRQIRARERQKREYEEKLTREKPEYDRIRNLITENPRVVLAEEFYVRDDTPATRALKSTLGDYGVGYPEEVLIDLLEKLPPDNHWIRAMIFSRPELTAKTIERFYPKALDWGAHLSYTILANIANHPNAPVDLIKDLAGRADLPIGATRPAQDRLKRMIEKESANKPMQPTGDTRAGVFEDGEP